MKVYGFGYGFEDIHEMTVGELIDVLTKYKRSMIVTIEGGGGDGLCCRWASLKVGCDEIMDYVEM